MNITYSESMETLSYSVSLAAEKTPRINIKNFPYTWPSKLKVMYHIKIVHTLVVLLILT